MFGSNTAVKSITTCLGIVLSATIASAPIVAMAQDYVPPKRGIPGRREGAGTRGNCLKGTKPLMPLIPSDAFSATISDRPVFFWYVPSVASTVTVPPKAEFKLFDGSRSIHSGSVDLMGGGKVISYQLPANVMNTALQPGKDYRWQFSVICNSNGNRSISFVEGTFQRLQPSATLTEQLNRSSVEERPKVLATAGVWQDAIATLAQQRCNRPQDSKLLASWTRLLQSVQLGNYVNESLAATCPNVSSTPSR
ncbi:DUF928 domain-containing protein [Pantanalinema sp. GBBB05]|uniref:DUF928 domain-containing protein n=1 Tax=Pantanalinema sp. GBBB05 TaxID=2604139 RepID=UPI001D34A48B|nr:DUF928 domain-containing protein [Pantanalinema sp. GBBB05]